MKRIVMVAAALVALGGYATAQQYQLGPIRIEQPWTRATPKGATIAAGYMKITNTGSNSDRVVGGSATFASGLELHEMATDGGVMKMRKLGGGVEIKPGETVEFKPGSYHVMFTGLARPLAKGERVKASLTFEKAGTIELEYPVQPVGAAGPGG